MNDNALPAANAGASEAALFEALAMHARTIEECLDHLLPLQTGLERRLLEAMRYAALGGGKRLRGFLVMEVASLFKVATTCAARVAASVEMLHAYSLVHDDLPSMDNDDLRRGKPSAHRAFDEATAILAGDALQARAFEVLAEEDTHSDAHRALRAGARPRRCGRSTRHGRRPDDRHGYRKARHSASLKSGRLQALKTGRLIQYSAEAGAILGRAPPTVRSSIVAYGRDIGAAFQIADDVLDAIGTVEQIGKTAGKDQAAGKATVVSLLGG